MSAPLTDEERARWAAWKHASGVVLERVRRDVRVATGLSDADFGVLRIVADADPSGDGALPVRQQHLCDVLGWTQSRMSNHISRMEGRGLVLREPLAAGGVEVSMTAEGTQRFARAVPVHAVAVRRHLLERLDDDAHLAIAELAADLATSPG
ncbi:MarR family winged helix-turn-helix transcriptional regulator [Patulibacter sp. NPDC049589]|uniref:MarR family winged helix-turn-helix transcriptional regulator n=1 Tax=Patulibacter sp. NPDC049589 TaxID=3154731 RepID=UPI00343A16AA